MNRQAILVCRQGPLEQPALIDILTFGFGCKWSGLQATQFECIAFDIGVTELDGPRLGVELFALLGEVLQHLGCLRSQRTLDNREAEHARSDHAAVVAARLLLASFGLSREKGAQTLFVVVTV